MTQPYKKFQAGAIAATIWENRSSEQTPYHTVSLEKSYKTKENEWKKSGSLRTTDLPKAILVLEQAYAFLSLKPQPSS